MPLTNRAFSSKRAERVDELQLALAHVRQLEGFIAICSYCKRIRSDAQQWEQMEHYISDHSNAQFSHGICPGCYAGIIEPQLQALRRARPQAAAAAV